MGKAFQDCWAIRNAYFTDCWDSDQPVLLRFELKSKQSDRTEYVSAHLTFEQANKLATQLQSAIDKAGMKHIESAKKEARKWVERSLWASSVNMAEEAESCRSQATKVLIEVSFGNVDSFIESVKDDWQAKQDERIKQEKDSLLIELHKVKEVK